MANGHHTYLHQVRPDQYQVDVDAFFRRRSGYWREVYEDETNFLSFYFRERRSRILAMADGLGLPEGSSVLEVGCGAGLTAIELAKRGYSVDAVDHVKAMLDLTRRAALETGVDGLVKTTQCSVLEMNFPPQRFELAVAVGVMPWLDQPIKAFWELNRVLKPGGHVILTSANRWCMTRIVDPLRLPFLRTVRWKVQDALESLNLVTRLRPRNHVYSIKEIDEILFQTGFRKVQGFTIGFGPFTIFTRRVRQGPLEAKIHRRLQALADRQFPGIRSCGTEHAVMAVKTT